MNKEKLLRDILKTNSKVNTNKWKFESDYDEDTDTCYTIYVNDHNTALYVINDENIYTDRFTPICPIAKRFLLDNVGHGWDTKLSGKSILLETRADTIKECYILEDKDNNEVYIGKELLKYWTDKEIKDLTFEVRSYREPVIVYEKHEAVALLLPYVKKGLN